MLNESLQSYQIPLSQPALQSPKSGLTLQAKLDCRHTFIGVILGEIFWIAIIISYSNNLFFNAVLSMGSGILLAWSSYGLYHRNVSKSHVVFFLHAALQICMYVLAEELTETHFVVCGSGTLMALLTLYEIFVYKKLQTVKVLIYLYLFYGLFVYSAYKNKEIDDTQWPSLIIPIDIYCVIGFIALFILFKKRDQFPKIARYRFHCLVYIWTIVLTFSLAGDLSSAQDIPWQVFTVFSHGAFFQIVYMTLKKRHQFLIIQDKEGQNPRMFQVSDSLLIGNEDYLHNPRISMQGGKPVAACIVCLTNQCEMCYENCGHLCLCGECASVWLTKSVKKCPICRTVSGAILYVERYQGIIFEVKKKYKIN